MEQMVILFSSLVHIIYILTQTELQIDAHRAPLAAIVLSSNGMYIATASEQGTIIRVHLVSDATKVRIAHHPFKVLIHGEQLWYLIICLNQAFKDTASTQVVHKETKVKIS
jgi:hypothetical protein